MVRAGRLGAGLQGAGPARHEPLHNPVLVLTQVIVPPATGASMKVLG